MDSEPNKMVGVIAGIKAKNKRLNKLRVGSDRKQDLYDWFDRSWRDILGKRWSNNVA
jgi:hypothetical protein